MSGSRFWKVSDLVANEAEEGEGSEEEEEADDGYMMDDDEAMSERSDPEETASEGEQEEPSLVAWLSFRQCNPEDRWSVAVTEDDMPPGVWKELASGFYGGAPVKRSAWMAHVAGLRPDKDAAAAYSWVKKVAAGDHLFKIVPASSALVAGRSQTVVFMLCFDNTPNDEDNKGVARFERRHDCQPKPDMSGFGPTVWVTVCSRKSATERTVVVHEDECPYAVWKALRSGNFAGSDASQGKTEWMGGAECISGASEVYEWLTKPKHTKHNKAYSETDTASPNARESIVMAFSLIVCYFLSGSRRLLHLLPTRLGSGPRETHPGMSAAPCSGTSLRRE